MKALQLEGRQHLEGEQLTHANINYFIPSIIITIIISKNITEIRRMYIGMAMVNKVHRQSHHYSTLHHPTYNHLYP